MKNLVASLFLFLSLHSQNPILQEPVSDMAELIEAGAEAEINRICRILWDSTSTQMAVITVESIGERPLELAAIDTANALGLGSKSLNNGILLFIVKDKKKIRIEVGYGLEGALTDAESSFIIRNVIAKEFKDGNYSEGVLNGIKAIATEIMDEYQQRRNPESEIMNTDEKSMFIFIFILFLLSLGIDIIRYKSRNDFEKKRYPHFFPWFTAFGIFFIILRLALHSAASGGFSSGGRERGGGGYSGGGGRFGGGGASGGW
jgi:uncharacterized protein